MYLDTSHNSLSTVHKNIYSSFKESAIKMMAYIKCLPIAKKPNSTLVVRTIGDLLELGWCLSRRGGDGNGRDSGRKGSRGKNTEGNAEGKTGGKMDKYEGYKCEVSKKDIRRLGIIAILEVVRRKQSGYAGVVKWLEGELGKGKEKGKGESKVR